MARLHLAQRLRAGSASLDDQGPPSPRLTAEGRLCLARRPRASSASPDGRGQTPPHPTSTPRAFIRMSTGYNMTFKSNAAPRTMPCAAAGKVPPGYDGMGALDHSGIVEFEQYYRHCLQPLDMKPDIDIRQPLRSRERLAPSTNDGCTITAPWSQRSGTRSMTPWAH